VVAVTGGGLGAGITTGGGAGAGGATVGGGAAVGAAVAGAGAAGAALLAFDCTGTPDDEPPEDGDAYDCPPDGSAEPTAVVFGTPVAALGLVVAVTVATGALSTAICLLVVAIDCRSWVIAASSAAICLAWTALAFVVALAVTGAEEPTAHDRESPVTPTVAAATTADGTEPLRRLTGLGRDRGSAIVLRSAVRRRNTPVFTTVVTRVGGGRHRGGRFGGLGRRWWILRLGGARHGRLPWV
jgi:hypothetical protein